MILELVEEEINCSFWSIIKILPLIVAKICCNTSCTLDKKKRIIVLLILVVIVIVMLYLCAVCYSSGVVVLL